MLDEYQTCVHMFQEDKLQISASIKANLYHKNYQDMCENRRVGSVPLVAFLPLLTPLQYPLPPLLCGVT